MLNLHRTGLSLNNDDIAIIEPRGNFSYSRLRQATLTTASHLLTSVTDLSENRVAFLLPPGFDYVATQRAIWAAGGIAVPLGLNHPRPELEYVIDDAGASMVIADPDLLERVAGITQARKIPLINVSELQVGADQMELPNIEVARRAMMLYTSGSTGRPKGVVTTHRNILAQIDSLVEAWEWTSQDHILHVLPLHHIHAIINVLGCAMRVGATCEFQISFDPVGVWKRLSAGDLTLFMAVPTIYAKLIAAWKAAPSDLQKTWSDGAKKLRLMVSGSAALPITTLEKWEQITGQRLLERYGMTEIGMGLSNPLHGIRRAGHVGRPLPRVEIQRTDSEGNLVPDSVPGEIEVRGPNVFLEYWNRKKATREAFRNGWFRTGDIAIVDEGDYRILGRESVDIIKTGGYKVSALEIEDVLRTHAAVHDCAVVGVADPEWGERVAVCIVSAEGRQVELQELRDWCKEKMAPYKAPTLLCMQDELPRNAMGKVQKLTVQKLFQNDDNAKC